MLRQLVAYLRTRRELLRLSDRALRDIGIEPAQLRLPAGPSVLVPQPALLVQLQDPPMAAAEPPEREDRRRASWINGLRAPATRPI